MSRRLKILLIIIGIAILAGGFVYIWKLRTGRVFLSAQTQICQNQGQIASMYGGNQWSIGAQLVPVNFLGKEVLFHKEAAPWLKKVAQEIQKNKIRYRINDAQTFNWRVKTTGYGQSLHSYGIAIDINPSQNPYSFSGQLVTNMPRKFINIFKKYGFYWGGDWQGFKDPMHFEWYGVKITGKLIDKYTKDLVESAIVYTDGQTIGRVGKNYSFAIPEGRHLVVIKNPKYKDYRFKIKASCNQIFLKDIALQPIPLGVPGKISGKVILPPQSPLDLPADIYVDGVYAVKTDVNGKYSISDVLGGVVHLVEAKIIPIFVGSTKVKVDPGKTSRDVNIEVVPGTNR
jgi:hypothetical protein